MGSNLKFPPANCSKWLQIVNTESCHWVLLAKGFLGIEDAIVFDSMDYQPERREHVINCLCQLENEKETVLRYWSSSCQRQANGFDCGVFAIAFAVSLAFGDNPALLAYDPKRLGTHLKKCFSTRELKPFPSRATRSQRLVSLKSYSVELFCYCRMPDGFFPLGQDQLSWIFCDSCENSFHKICVPKLPKRETSKWYCDNCKQMRCVKRNK